MKERCRRRRRRICALLLVLATVCSVGTAFGSQAKTVQGTDAKAAQADGEGCQLAVVMGDGTVSTSPLALFRTVSNGEVTGDGVRLRKTASSSGTVLELMSVGEAVNVHLSQSKPKTGWYYLTRCKTGTKGYASTKYIYVY